MIFHHNHHQQHWYRSFFFFWCTISKIHKLTLLYPPKKQQISSLSLSCLHGHITWVLCVQNGCTNRFCRPLDNFHRVCTFIIWIALSVCIIMTMMKMLNRSILYILFKSNWVNTLVLLTRHLIHLAAYFV